MAKEIEELIREFLNETEQEDEVENSMCLEDIYTGEKFRTKVTEEGRGWLKKGDIIRGDLGKIGDRWVIVDFWGIYPNMAKWYIIG
jgi:hypothetical protein